VELGLGGRTALVTGASRGIGRACVDALVAEGVRVFAVARDKALLSQLASDHDGMVAFAVVDLSTDDGCDDAYQQCEAAFGAPGVLVNCAGAAGMGNVLDISREEIDSALRLKFHGCLRMAQLVAPGMKAAGWGRIVNVAGSAGTSPTADNLPTSLANIAIHNATRALSDELAPFGVLVNVISPGLTLTDRARTLFAKAAAADERDPDELIADVAATLPAGRAAEVAEIARVATFLASDACSYVFGSVLYMDGGSRRATP
jgi:3-oxoacyl-[acyl-carrier protein] reductase